MKSTFYLILISIFVISSCGKDDIDNPNNDPGPNPPSSEKIIITGLVSDLQGNAIKDALITIDGESHSTDLHGFFRIEDAAGAENALVVEKNGYFKTIRKADNATSEVQIMNIQLITRNLTDRFNASDASNVKLGSELSIAFPEDAVGHLDGSAYNGEVRVYAHYFDPTNENLIQTMPGDLSGLDVNGSLVQLASFGMVAVELESTAGTPLQLRPNKNATVTIAVPSDLLSNAPDEIQLWHLDEENGRWIEEGKAQLVSNTYEAEVSHFSFWNVDIGMPSAYITGKMVDSDGDPLIAYPVGIKWDQDVYTRYDYTNAKGEFKGYVPSNENLNMVLRHCGVKVYDEAIGPFSGNTDLGTITVADTDFTVEIRGRLLNCAGNPIGDAYGVIKTGYDRQIVIPDSDGNFVAQAIGCGTQMIDLRFYDLNDLQATDPLSIDPSSNGENYGDLTICDLDGEYIAFTIDNTEQHVIDEVEVLILNEETVFICGRDNISSKFIRLVFPSIASGETTPDDIYAYAQNSTGDYVNGQCGESTNYNNNITPCDVVVDVTQSGTTGDLITGDFEGLVYSEFDTIQSGSSNIVDISGFYNLTIDQAINTGSVSGRVWFDLNGDGIEDSSEDHGYCGANMRLQRVDGGLLKIESSYNPTDDDGSYILENLIPNVEYSISFYAVNQYGLSQQDAPGSNDQNNSDFTIDNQHATYTFTLSDGENLEEIDLGLTVESFNAFLYNQGCPPLGGATLTGSQNGGVKPFNYSFSNGVDGPESIANISSGGNYSVTITDAIGNSAIANTFVPDYNNRVTGKAWLDDEDGVDDVFDCLYDEIYKGIKVEMLDASGTAVSNFETTSAGYAFDTVSPGEYQLKVTVPTGYQLVLKDQGGNDWSDSDFDPDTGLSDKFTVEECNEYFYLDIGLKEN